MSALEPREPGKLPERHAELPQGSVALVFNRSPSIETRQTSRGDKPGGSGFPLFSGKALIVSRTLSGMFLVGAFDRA